MFNRLFALVMLIVLPPIFLIVAFAILIEDGFPFLFTQKRVCINYSFFKIYKFRSTKKNTPNVATHLLTNLGQYLLKIGNLIRKTTIDELPNLINIIKGEMIFVGPRPAFTIKMI
jgi:O-antigen biosynthesis protein WbqP